MTQAQRRIAFVLNALALGACGMIIASVVQKGAFALDGKLDRRGRSFVGFATFEHFAHEASDASGALTLTSPEIPAGIAANEVIVSWNADAPAGTGIKVEARAFCVDHYTMYYVLGLWSPDAGTFPRSSVKGQKDADGNVDTDTLALQQPATKIQIRVTLEGSPGGVLPRLKYLGVSFADTRTALGPLPEDRAAWGHEVSVPGRTQLGWPGAAGWCSPTSTDMTLAYWAGQLKRPELDMPVPDVAHAIYDKVYDGTGNWPFNTAFAGSFQGMRAYVARLSDVTELEQWVLAGIPPVVSVSYDLLQGKDKDNDPGHLMVCDGFTATGDIVLNDPAHHPERGEICRRVFPRARFVRAWNRSHFLVYLIYPVGSTVPKDLYGHWDSEVSTP